MVKKYIVRLSEEERSLLRDIVKKLPPHQNSWVNSGSGRSPS